MKKIGISVVILIIVLVAFFGWIQISRQIEIDNFRNKVCSYLDNRYNESMCIKEVSISLTEGMYATAYPEGNPLLEFNIREFEGKIIDGYLATCLENELSENIKNDILMIDYNYKCIVKLNGNSLIEENLYDLYKQNNRPAKIEELAQVPVVEHLILSFNNNSKTLSEDEIHNIVKIIHENFNDNISWLVIYENDNVRLKLVKQELSEFIDK